MSAPVRVLVADDSQTARRFLVEILSAHPGMVVVGEAADGAEAVELTRRLSPSVVVMDAVMPKLDGFEATAQIMTEVPTPVVVVTAALDPDHVATALRTVEVGALAVLPKPVWSDVAVTGQQATSFARRIASLSAVSVIRRYRRPPTSAPPLTPLPTDEWSAVRIVGVAASTGGPQALYQLLARLPGDLPVPVVVVQHIADGFVAGFARWLDGATPLEVVLAADGDPLLAGRIYVAPEDRHLRTSADGKATLGDDAPIGGFRPAATALFESLGATYGARAAGVILTGLGEDGLAGLISLRGAGGTVLAQDESSSVVFGMPGVVVAAGIAHTVGPVPELAARIIGLTKGQQL